MATLVAIKFPTTDGAQTMLYTLENLQKQQLIQIQDGAIVTWPEGAKKPKTKQLTSMTGLGALGGAFWGMLFGLLFFIPFFGLAVGAAIGALMGHFAHYGIDEGFIDQVRSKITPGTSALFLLDERGSGRQGCRCRQRPAVRDHSDQPVQRARREAPRGLRRRVKQSVSRAAFVGKWERPDNPGLSS